MALIDPALAEYIGEQQAYNSKLMETTAAMDGIDTESPAGLQWIRAAMAPGGLFGLQSLDFPTTREIPGPAGPISVRVMTPPVVDGVYLHFHGGGMTLGSALSMDTRNWPIAQAVNVAVVSVDYRLAPEDPFPAGPDDAKGDGANRSHYLPGRSLEEARDPAVSPLWADLRDLPPSLLTVGTADWLLDDSLFAAARLEAAGNEVELAVYPEGPHGIESSPTALGRAARDRLHAFLRKCL